MATRDFQLNVWEQPGMNKQTLDERLEVFKNQILDIKKPQYNIGEPIHDKTKNKDFILKRDILLDWQMADSEAFKSLSANAIRALLRFLQKRTWKGKGKNRIWKTTGLVFTYAEAKELGIKTSSFHGIIKKLYEIGFIEIEHQGGGLAKDFSRYALSERWKTYGTPHFKPVTKKRICRTGFDVHSRKQLKQVTRNRNYQLRKTVTIDESASGQGIGKL